MKKTITINISGIVFHIEEDGYEVLRTYLSSIGRYFSTYADSKEITADIESRIAEIFLARLTPSKQVITAEDVDSLIIKMGNIADFEAIEEEEFGYTGAATATASATSTATGTGTTTTPPKKLYRDLRRKLIGGVASGIGHYLTVDPLWIRLVFLFSLVDLFFLPGSFSSIAFITYVVLWIVVPGSSVLEEDKGVKKLYRNPDKRTVGGVASGIASYFGVDETVIRLLFVVSIFFFGGGILLYLILWAIVPEAKTITEKMQMQGEPVTLSNIEQNVKKNFQPSENGEESTLIKILLFPFRVIAAVFSALSQALGPIAYFLLDAIRVAAGVVLITGSVFLLIALCIAFFVAMGWTDSYNFIHFGNFPAELIRQSFPVWVYIPTFLALVIPTIAFGLLGIRIIAKHRVVSPVFGWTLFSIYILSLIGSGIALSLIVGQFRTKSSFEQERAFANVNKPLYLDIRRVADEEDNQFISLVVEPYEGDVPKLTQTFRAFGRNRQDAVNNARMTQYAVSQQDSVITFDSDLTFRENAQFRGQSLRLTLLMPYNQPFAVDNGLEEILDGYEFEFDGSSERNIWRFEQGKGLVCQNCPDEEIIYNESGESRTSPDGQIRTFNLRDFDRLDIGSAFEIDVQQGDTYKVTVSGDPDDVEEVEAQVSGDELEISYKRDLQIWDWDFDRKRVRVEITMPELAGVTFSGASESEVRGFTNANEVDIQVTSAAKSVIELNADRISIHVNSAADVELRGKARQLQAEVSSAARLRAFDLETEEAEVDASSSALAQVHATRQLNAEASSAGRVRYQGNPNVDSNVSSAGSVSRD